MKPITPLLAVADVERSKRFYGELFDQVVVLDLGENVTFSGGFAIQQDFAQLVGLPADTVVTRAHNMELYFEADDFDAFMARLEAHEGIDFLHRPRTYPWQQRVVRIYDPDGHLIEIGESMEVIARRFRSEGRTPEEIAPLMHCPLPYIEELLAEKAAPSGKPNS